MSDERTPLTELFPDLQPDRRPGNLGAVNGFGTALIGRRGFHPETGTYVVTHVVTALFIPIWALAAYRVADAPGGGWYCLGRVPLSRLARGLNLLLVLAVASTVGGIWWNAHTKSPEYVAARKLDRAAEAASGGKSGEAAKLYREVMDSKTAKAEEARTKLGGLIENPAGPPSEAAAVYAVAIELHRENRCPVSNLFDKGKELATRYSAEDPVAALALLEVIAPFAPDAAAELAVRREILQKLLAKSPNDPEVASRLAAVYEETGEREKCAALLTPFESRLGSLDGAAILGRIHSSRGDFDKAHALLAPFVAARLPSFRKAEEEFTREMKGLQERVINQLKTGKAPGFDYDKYDRLPKEQQIAMVESYLSEQVKTEPTLRTSRQKVMAERGVVGAVLDLGMVQLQRAQKMADPAARKAELEAAEKTFLTIRSTAGESDQYRLALGQVYYWLGRPAEGKKLFDELLAARGRPTNVMLMVAHQLREVGETTEARSMVEAAYAKELDATAKYRAAGFRAVMFTDLDDEILWLGRCDPNAAEVKASLSVARGRKAEREGKDAEAVDHYRQALATYAQMPESAATLNNASLAHFALFQVTLDREEFTRGLDKLDRAVALDPTNSISLLNASGVAADGAARDIVGKEIDFRVIKSSSAWEAIGYLYRTPAERAAIAARLASHPGLVKGRAYANKLLLLAPKRDDSYRLLARLCEYANDLGGLKEVAARVAKAELDLADDVQKYQEFLSGKSDGKKLEEARASVTRAEGALPAARKLGGRTFAIAAGRYVNAKIAAWYLGEKADADALVKLAEEANGEPSAGSEATLQHALLFRAHAALAKEDAAYGEAARRTQRSFGTSLVYYVLATDGALRSKAAKNADMKRLAALAEESFRRDPSHMDAREWALLAAVGSERADAAGAKAKANEWASARREVNRAVTPYHASTALDEYCHLTLEGKAAEAKKVIADLTAKGVAVP